MSKKASKKHTTPKTKTTRLISEVMALAGRMGGKARAEKMTPEERRASALKASQAAAKARTIKAGKGSKRSP